jgi:hypothetical protein
MEIWAPEATWPPQLVGLGFAIAGMAFGSLVTGVRGHRHRAAHPSRLAGMDDGRHSVAHRESR